MNLHCLLCSSLLVVREYWAGSLYVQARLIIIGIGHYENHIGIDDPDLYERVYKCQITVGNEEELNRYLISPLKQFSKLIT